MFMNELIVKYKVATCHYIYSRRHAELKGKYFGTVWSQYDNSDRSNEKIDLLPLSHVIFDLAIKKCFYSWRIDKQCGKVCGDW